MFQIWAMPGEFYLSWLWHLVRHQDGTGLITARSLRFWGSPAGALTWQYRHPWTDVLPAVAHGGRQKGRGCQALPLPCHTDPRGQAGWAMADAANCIPRLLTHSLLSWVTILGLWLCYLFLVVFVHFLSPGSTLWAEQCESDRGINLTFGKKSIAGKHLYFNKGTFDLNGFSIQIRSRASEQLCQHKQGTACHDGGMGVRGKVGSGKMPVAPKAGQVGTAIPHVYQSDGSKTKWVPAFLYIYELLRTYILLNAPPSCGEREIGNEHSISPNFKVFECEIRKLDKSWKPVSLLLVFIRS